MKYCTYLTIYKGSKLPTFYIGYSTVDKVLNKNYHGTVSSKKYGSIWKKDLRDNPHLFKTKILSLHLTMFDAKARETFLQTSLNVTKNPLYVNQHIQGTKFCIDRTGMLHSEETKEKFRRDRVGKMPTTKGTHISAKHKAAISQKLTGRKRSAETVEKMANSRRGKKNTKKFSEESNLKRSKTMKEKMTAQRKEELSLLHQGENNPFFGKTHSDETKDKMRNADRSYLKSLRWWTNGQSVVRSAICPGDDWQLGRKLN